MAEKGLPGDGPPRDWEEFLSQTLSLAKASREEWLGSSFNRFDVHLSRLIGGETEGEGLRGRLEEFLRGLAEVGRVSLSLDVARPGVGEGVEKLNLVLADVARGLMEEGCFQPALVANIYPDTRWSSPSLERWMGLSYRFGQPIFQNMATGTIRTESLDRLASEEPHMEFLHLRLGGPTGCADGQGVYGWGCINLHQLAMSVEGEEAFMEALSRCFWEVVDALSRRSRGIRSRWARGGMPFTLGLSNGLNWCFNVVTLTGANEAFKHLVGAPLGHPVGKALAYQVLELLRDLALEAQSTHGELISIETYPSESPGLERPGLWGAVTPGTELAADHGDDLWDALEHQKKLHSLYTGGTLFEVHLDRGRRLTPGLKLLITRIIEVYGFNYLAISPRFALCPSDGYSQTLDRCFRCGGEVEEYTRVDGWLKPMSQLPEQIQRHRRRRVWFDVKSD